MNAFVNNHLVEIIEQQENGLWVVYDTQNGLFYEVSTAQLLCVEDQD